ncbi:MAG TPA: DUF4124 domain-containing protein [Rhodanobacteraceae bacterium]|nr:DUF4124 domain-containing protein [Rhodanobacteraceae bacterium]
MRALLLFALMVPLLCLAHAAQAQIHRCIGAQGEPVFTDQPCGAAELAVAAASGSLGHDGQPDATNTASPSGGTRIAATCPRSPQQVRDRIAVAFNDNNPNALAGLFDWRGFSHASADARLKDFSRWLKQPLVGVQFSGADPSGAQPGDADYTPSDPSGLTVLTQSGARSFGMAEKGGCWWLMF